MKDGQTSDPLSLFRVFGTTVSLHVWCCSILFVLFLVYYLKSISLIIKLRALTFLYCVQIQKHALSPESRRVSCILDYLPHISGRLLCNTTEFSRNLNLDTMIVVPSISLNAPLFRQCSVHRESNRKATSQLMNEIYERPPVFLGRNRTIVFPPLWALRRLRWILRISYGFRGIYFFTAGIVRWSF